MADAKSLLGTAAAAAGYKVACMVYKVVLRELLLKAVNDPDAWWDDKIMAMCDGLFGYTEE